MLTETTSQINLQFNTLQKTLEELFDKVALLRERLNPVLKLEPPTDPNIVVARKIATPSISPFAERLQDNVNRIESILTNVNKTLDLLDL